ncbi:glycosyltransferase family 4 protein [bacterium]|nr:glycosyltransferase family 4 protein [bacterium]
MKKYIFVHLLNDFSGSPKVLSQVIQAVQEQGIALELYTGKSESGFLSGLTTNHHQYFYKRSEHKWITLVTFLSSQIILFFKLLKYTNKDIVIYVNTMLPFGAALAGFVMRKPVIYHVHEISLTPLALKHFLRAVIRLTAKKIIFVSSSVQSSEKFSGKKEYVVYNALSDSFVNNALNQNNVKAKDGFNVLMLASLKVYKGLQEFVEIAKSLESNAHISFTLVINATQKDVNIYFRDKDLTNNIEILSSKSDVIPFYQKASLVLNLSHVDAWVETFGLTIVEAMAFGIPVIVPPVGGPSEIVTDGVEGYLMNSKNTNSIAKIIGELSIDKVSWAELSKNALSRSKYFNQATFEKEIIKVLNA